MSAALADLVGLVTIGADLCSAAVAGEILAADDPQALRRELPHLVYEVLHAGRRSRPGSLPFNLRDPDLERRLAAATPHATTTVAARYLDGHERGPDMLVERDGVRVWVPAAAVRRARPGDTATTVATMTVAAARPALSPGFFLVESSVPARRSGPTLRLYLHLTDPTAAPAAWARVLGHLEDGRLPYRAKVLSAPALYPRRDALVVYLPPGSWTAVDGLAALSADLPGLGADTSTFARRLRPGVASAWEPADPREHTHGQSFGQHRAGVLGHALFDAVRDGADPCAALLTACREANVDPADPSRNRDSPDPAGLPAGGAGPLHPLSARRTAGTT